MKLNINDRKVREMADLFMNFPFGRPWSSHLISLHRIQVYWVPIRDSEVPESPTPVITWGPLYRKLGFPWLREAKFQEQRESSVAFYGVGLESHMVMTFTIAIDPAGWQGNLCFSVGETVDVFGRSLGDARCRFLKSAFIYPEAGSHLGLFRHQLGNLRVLTCLHHKICEVSKVGGGHGRAGLREVRRTGPKA